VLTVAGSFLTLLRAKSEAEAAPAAGEVSASRETRSRQLRRGLVTAVLILGIGSLIPLSEMPFPLRYVDYSDKRSGFAALEAGGMLGQTGIKPEVLKRFLRNPQATIVVGRALYPRYYWVGGGESASDYPYLPLEFPRLAFTLIGPTGRKGVILPGDMPAHFQNASDVIVLGCRSAKYIDALLVYVSSEPRKIYMRSPTSPLTCPLRQPYCVDKTTCR
jgi:hypothetical protein